MIIECIICSYDITGTELKKFTVCFQPIRKELESSMYNKLGCQRANQNILSTPEFQTFIEKRLVMVPYSVLQDLNSIKNISSI